MSNGWYYASGGVQSGPVELEALKAMQAAGQLAPDVLVWREGMGEWKPLQEVPELKSAPSLITGSAPAAAAPVASGQIYAPPAANPMLGMGAGMQVKPPTYLWQSIAATLLCCLPFGIVGIVYAAKVDGLAAAGNTAAALEASNKAKFWCWMSFGFGLVATILVIAGGALGA